MNEKLKEAIVVITISLLFPAIMCVFIFFTLSFVEYKWVDIDWELVRVVEVIGFWGLMVAWGLASNDVDLI